MYLKSPTNVNEYRHVDPFLREEEKEQVHWSGQSSSNESKLQVSEIRAEADPGGGAKGAEDPTKFFQIRYLIDGSQPETSIEVIFCMIFK